VKFGVILFQAFEILDVFGPLEALNMLSRTRHLEMFLISETMDPVATKPVMAPMNPFDSTFVSAARNPETLASGSNVVERSQVEAYGERS